MASRKDKSCRVWVVQHPDGSVTGVLMRQWNAFFDAPPPSAFGRSLDEVLARLDEELKRRDESSSEPLERYLWSETFTVHTVDIDFHPQTFVDKRPVIGAASFPLTLAFAACKVHPGDPKNPASPRSLASSPAARTAAAGPFRVGLPRYGWWLMLESLDMAKDAISLQLGAALMGEKTASVLDFRRDGKESVREFTPRLVDLTDDTDDDDLAETHPVTSLVADDLVDRVRRGLLPAPHSLELEPSIAYRVNDLQPISFILVGPPGCGKTARVRQLAHKLARTKAVGRRKRHLFATSKDRLLAGMMLLGQWEERVLSVIDELRGRGDLLFVDRLSELLEPLSDGGSIGDLLYPAVERKEIGLIAEATPDELARLRQRHPRWFDCVWVVNLNPMPEAQLGAWLPSYAESAELARAKRETRLALATIDPTRPTTKVTPVIVPWTQDGLARLLDLQRTFEPHQAQPGKAARFIDWWVERQGAAKRMDEQAVAAAYARFQRLPESLVAGRASSADATLRALTSRVIGQPEACRLAARIVARFRAGLCDPNRPVGTLLFLGPTGVGKTELAKALTEVAFSDGQATDPSIDPSIDPSNDQVDRIDRGAHVDRTNPTGRAARTDPTGRADQIDRIDRMIRLDMSEYHLPWSVDRLFQVGPGVTSLAERVRQNPISLVLFDEVEKAHPAVFDALLGVLDEGRLTDQRGHSVDFRMTIIVMTSNVGAGGPKSSGFFGSNLPDYRAALSRQFRPEFLNRIDHIVPFSPLDESAISQILDLELAKINRREGLVRRGLTLTIDPETRKKIIAEGFHPEYGARALRRTLEDLVVTPIARALALHPTTS